MLTCSAHEKVWSGGLSVQPLLPAEHRPHSWLQYGYCSHGTEQPGCQLTCRTASCHHVGSLAGLAGGCSQPPGNTDVTCVPLIMQALSVCENKPGTHAG